MAREREKVPGHEVLFDPRVLIDSEDGGRDEVKLSVATKENVDPVNTIAFDAFMSLKIRLLGREVK